MSLSASISLKSKRKRISNSFAKSSLRLFSSSDSSISAKNLSIGIILLILTVKAYSQASWCILRLFPDKLQPNHAVAHAFLRTQENQQGQLRSPLLSSFRIRCVCLSVPARLSLSSSPSLLFAFASSNCFCCSCSISSAVLYLAS